MKKIVMFTAAVASAFGISSAALADTEFYDITAPQYEWCADAIIEMANDGYINGYGDGTFRPDNEVTRLECIALFSRILGSADRENDEIIEMALKEYNAELEKCALSWGEAEVAYMLYRGALTTGDLTTYLKGSRKNEPMERGEAAVIITRAMLGEDEALDYDVIDLHYTDENTIPASLRPYAKYVTDNGIMNGIDDTFYAKNGVTRSQVSVMMHRVLTKRDYSFKKARVSSVDTKNKTVSYVADNEYYDFAYNDSTKFYVCGEKASDASIGTNVDVMLIYSNGGIVAVDALTKRPDTQITVIFDGYNISDEVMTVRVSENEYSQVYVNYVCDVSLEIINRGSAATIRDIKRGDEVKLLISGGEVISIIANENTVTTDTVDTVKITDISYENQVTYISVYSDSTGDMTYPVKAGASINGEINSASLSSISVGSTVTLTIVDGEIANIESASTSTVVKGEVVSVRLSEESPRITVYTDEGDVRYDIKPNHTVIIDGEIGELYDIEEGDEVTLTVSNGVVTEIKKGSLYDEPEYKNGESFSFIGEVLEIDDDSEIITLESEDFKNDVRVYVNSNTEFTLRGDTAEYVDIDDLREDDVVKCYVTKSGSRYVADIIIIY